MCLCIMGELKYSVQRAAFPSMVVHIKCLTPSDFPGSSTKSSQRPQTAQLFQPYQWYHGTEQSLFSVPYQRNQVVGTIGTVLMVPK